jgi:hypothetical protein
MMNWPTALLMMLASTFVSAGTGSVSNDPFSSGKGVMRLSEPVEVTDSFETFGSPLPEQGETVPLAMLLTRGQEFLGRSVKVRTRIAQVCQAKGCFFIAQEGGHSARVSFKDYGFFVPTDISGRTVTLAGELVEVTLTDEQASHLSADVGDPDALTTGRQYQIIATSVRVPKG